MAKINLLTLSTEELREAVGMWIDRNADAGDVSRTVENVRVMSHKQTIFEMSVQTPGNISFNDHRTVHMIGDLE